MKNSRLEYNNLRGNYRDGYAFQIDIKTMTDEGVIFYADQEDGNDLVALFMKNGQVKYLNSTHTKCYSVFQFLLFVI